MGGTQLLVEKMESITAQREVLHPLLCQFHRKQKIMQHLKTQENPWLYKMVLQINPMGALVFVPPLNRVWVMSAVFTKAVRLSGAIRKMLNFKLLLMLNCTPTHTFGSVSAVGQGKSTSNSDQLPSSASVSGVYSSLDPVLATSLYRNPAVIGAI
ncbi:Mucin-19-like [Quillaja saponaria]|uniref:Mucin-19-like n=1 Tax=Quillaja saponaria TaxID=32244 RepID=A0AAD7LMP7_QUISA|nr:Mucin-19-like [Quillaja saponaria]